jgi:hypothetical protein
LKGALARRHELVGERQGENDQEGRHPEAQEADQPFIGAEPRDRDQQPAPHERPEHDEKREGEHHEGAADDEQDRFRAG